MPEIQIARWRENKLFCYSITYDDGWVETLGFAWRLHRQYHIPGHVDVLPGMLGRLTGDMAAGFLQSLWNLQKYVGREHLHALRRDGWTVGCQFPPAAGDARDGRVQVLADLRHALETAVDCPVRCLAFYDATSAPDWADAAGRAGFEWLFTLHDALNDPDDASPIVKRSPLYHCGALPNHLANDPYRLLALARDRGAWVADVVRLVDRFPRDATRDCTPAELQARFEAVHAIGGGEVWVDTPATIADYRAVRANARIDDVVCSAAQIAFSLALSNSRATVPSLTLVCMLDDGWRSPRARTDRGESTALRHIGDGSHWLYECPAIDGIRVTITEALS